MLLVHAVIYARTIIGKPAWTLMRWRLRLHIASCIFAAQLTCGLSAWMLLFKLLDTMHGPYVFIAFALTFAIFLFYRAHNFLRSAFAWVKAWYQQHYPAHIPLAQRLDLKEVRVYDADNGIIIMASGSQIPVPRIHSAKSRHAAK